MIKIFGKFLLVYLLVIIVLAVIEYQHAVSDSYSALKHKNESVLYSIEQLIESNYNELISDAQFIANQSEFILQNTAIDSQSYLARTYLQFASSKKYFDQIRFIDTRGMEKIRVNINGSKAYLVPYEKLCDKSERYYYKHTIQLKKGEVYISPLDLNIENGEIEQPLKPMIRISMPIFNNKKERLGIVVINYLANQLLDKIEEFEKQINGNILLVNRWGYYVLGLKPEKEWGFMFPTRKRYSMHYDFTNVYNEIIQNNSGFIESDSGKFNYRTFQFESPDHYSLFYYKNEYSTAAVVNNKSRKTYEYKLVSYCTNKEFNSIVYTSLELFIKLLLYSMVPILLLGYIIAKYIILKRESDLKLKQKNQEVQRNIIELDAKNKQLYRKNGEVKKHLKKVSSLSEKLNDIKTELNIKDNQYKQLSSVNHEFTHMISRDLKGRFDSIFGISKLFSDPKNQEQLEKKDAMVKLLKRSAENANQLLNRMTIWSKEEIHSLPFNPEPFDLKVLVDDFILLHANEAEKKGVQLQSFMAKTTFVLADVSMICIVLKKMISNAILFSAKNGNVSVSTYERPNTGFIELRIKLSAVFKNTVESTTASAEIPNTSDNLNIFICNELIKRHNDEIHVTDNSITGTKYSFHLKVWHPEQN